jgi:NADH dehydrogenase
LLVSRGADIRAAAPVHAIEPGRVHLGDTTIEAETIVLAAGIVPSTAVAGIPVARDQHGRIAVAATMRSKSHPTVWALGDCASIPGPEGHPYPALAQHAIREARHLAQNVAAVVAGRAPTPFVFRSLGSMAAFGHTKAVAQVKGVRLTGFPAWWLRRMYYLLQMPRWDRRLRIFLDWTVALFFRPDITKVDLAVERVQNLQNSAAGVARHVSAVGTGATVR